MSKGAGPWGLLPEGRDKGRHVLPAEERGGGEMYWDSAARLLTLSDSAGTPRSLRAPL